MKLRIFAGSIFVTILCMGLAGYWGANHPMGITVALYTTLVLAIMEVSLSFDNAVINATKLKTLSPAWQKFFLTIGILVAVFGMRFFFPIEIVARTTDRGFMEVFHLALDNPNEYSRLLTAHHGEIAFFGGAFLLMIFLGFLFDDEKEHHWLGSFEKFFGDKFGNAKDVAASFITLLLVYVSSSFIENPETAQACLYAGGIGLMANWAVNMLEAIFEDEETGNNPATPIVRTGMAGFAGVMYLEVLDASFSFDGVIGAFAVTNDVVIIMLGLAIGAMFVRSLTIYLVKAGTLDEFVFLEHGASYAIGGLALIMFTSTFYHIPEWVPGLVGVGLIVLSLWSSIRKNKQEALVEDNG